MIHDSYRYVVIEGNLGAGKTTLVNLLADNYAYRPLLEQFADNPFLPFFYQQPERYAFPVELFFMTERQQQLQEHFATPDLFLSPVTIADYAFVKTQLFAHQNLKKEEYRLFLRLFDILKANFPKPDLLLYLHRPIDVLLTNIRRRGRDYEQQITPDYLLKVQQAYFDYFKSQPDIPIVLLECGERDFADNRANFQHIVGLLQRQYKPGLHRMVL